MKRQILAAFIAATGTLAQAADVAPGDVVFDNGAVAASLTGVAGDPESGQKVMSTRALGNCVACHHVSSLSAAFQGTVGPSLDGVGDRYDEAQLRGIVSNAKNTFHDTVMPSFYKSTGYIRPGDAFTGKAGTEPLPPLLTAQQIEDVVAYLTTLK